VSLLCTATNATPHERFALFDRRSMHGRSLPSWLIQPGPVMLPKQKWTSLRRGWIVGSQSYVCLPDRKELSVSIKDLSPCPFSDTSSHPSVETFGDNTPESSVPEPGREQDVTATPCGRAWRWIVRRRSRVSGGQPCASEEVYTL